MTVFLNLKISRRTSTRSSEIDRVAYILLARPNRLRLFQLMMPSHSTGLTNLKIARNGGLEHLIRLLRLSEEDIHSPPDVIFVSIDLEVSRQERAAILKDENHIPHVKELGIACLDTRLIFPLENSPGLTSDADTRFISTNQFSTSNASKTLRTVTLPTSKNVYLPRRFVSITATSLLQSFVTYNSKIRKNLLLFATSPLSVTPLNMMRALFSD
ncbi:hypothetical protein BJ170DRAFT_446019 [Xylariales sp. AK1849]|nr:hypothetical protein BJ170DRAFT_446019 [Xylariales sp. AK1849]